MKRILSAFVLSCVTCSAAVSAETSPFGQLLPPEATYRMTSPFEARLGGFVHEPGGSEKGSADISGEVIFGNISVNTDPWWDFVTMRAHVGGTFNTDAKTNGEYFGPIWTVALTDRFFVEASIDGAFNDGFTGALKPPPHHAGMGCHVGFHESFSLGYDLTEHWSVMATAEHYSNLNLCARNHGISNFGARIGYSF
ncbi:hypothetical protein CCR94_20880 [Rhodoblastus sphagnicola]|uniref:Acyloxyacyl hydrolase n=1 Tax=Rhodoblastus sphagnicola TaxID=333368 RepID=A0A2S6MXP3_9HYPH|nr:acyloxyacyl hydrolase [Rhodoblastus sphagnicola]MBB4196781.1 hypothetical protein [Rhodoblastus sphagnicola]PPQ27130.1 hypothetical protein CCR94_20880 [Rhodoblastus sphagnicola]